MHLTAKLNFITVGGVGEEQRGMRASKSEIGNVECGMWCISSAGRCFFIKDKTPGSGRNSKKEAEGSPARLSVCLWMWCPGGPA
jgi:hypothetical protein